MAYSTDPATGVSAEWTVSGQADNATSSHAKSAAGTGLKHYVTKVTYGYTAAPAAAKTVSMGDGTTTYFRAFLTTTDFGTKTLDFFPPLEIPANTIVTLTIPASGTAGVIGGGSIHGFTR